MAAVLDLSIPQIYHGLARENDGLVAPDAVTVLHVQSVQSVQQWSTHPSAAAAAAAAATAASPSRSPLESLPTEILNQILAHLVHPRSRLPGLTEAQSAHDFPRPTKLEIKNREDLTTLPDSHRWAADIFDFQSLRHPFHVLALTSKRLHDLVESYCGHLVRTCNVFNLPFAHYDKHGSTHPDLRHIVYRRLWLQHAPRLCIYCHVGLDCYPFAVVKRLIAACEDCFYRQTLTVDEVERQYHISTPTISSSPLIRGPGPGSPWVLRVDVEAMAFRLYGTRAFHAAHVDQFGKPCSICAFTRFEPQFSASTRSERGLKRGTTRPVRRVVSQKRKARRSRGFGSN
ncbi:hypothetical protein E8E12_009710 [Didymella heteroderae]|uniref:F-box domain-containing protein n=1 Tax=Didymella heteroderae TaxID=1769908 RepID=A0A9P4WVU9_9PLEO|nr:hypothetical protein E8E12_009710 [Didymella heteroderae]